MQTKQCKKCGRELPLDEYYRQPGYKDGHRRECKHCTIEQQMRHRKDDPDYQVTHHTGKRPKDMTPEEQREYNRQYHRRYREEHRDRVRQISRENIARARAGEPKRKRGPVKGAEPKPMPKPSTFSLGRKKPVKAERACLRCIHYPCFDGIENFVTDFASEGCHGYKQKGHEPLTEYERDTLLPVICRGLVTKVGEKMAITNTAITKAMRGAGYQLTEARLRKIINHIRTTGMVKWLIATSKGYYIATSRQEMEDYIVSLRGREDAIRAVRESMERQLLN